MGRVYIKYGNLPTSDDYDGMAYSSSEQALEISSSLSGYYYVMLESAASSGGSYTLTPKTSLAQLTPDTPVSGNLAWSGDTQYYEISSPNGEHLYIDLGQRIFLATPPFIFVAAGFPQQTEYDAKIAGTSALEVEIPYTPGGNCYVMVVSNSSSGGSFTSSARSHLSEVNPDINYTYDQLGRLTAVTYPTGAKETYVFDERGNRIQYRVQQGCAGDLGGDNDVDGSDLAAMIAQFGRTGCSAGNPCSADINGDGSVNADDLKLFAPGFRVERVPLRSAEVGRVIFLMSLG